jgi:hypothetical protein
MRVSRGAARAEPKRLEKRIEVIFIFELGGR